TALQNFFRNDHILQLRELALKEVAGHVERKVDAVVPPLEALRSERFLACISSNEQKAKTVIRKTARLASYYNGQWYVLYVQTPKEATVKIPLDKQRYLINNLKLATELGGTVLQIQHKNVPLAISELAIKYKVTTVCIGKPRLNLFRIILATGIFNQLLRKLSDNDIDLIILS